MYTPLCSPVPSVCVHPTTTQCWACWPSIAPWLGVRLSLSGCIVSGGTLPVGTSVVPAQTTAITGVYSATFRAPSVTEYQRRRGWPSTGTGAVFRPEQVNLCYVNNVFLYGEIRHDRGMCVSYTKQSHSVWYQLSISINQSIIQSINQGIFQPVYPQYNDDKLPKQVFVLNNAPLKWPAPMAHSPRLGLVTWRYEVRVPVGADICHRGCAYTMLQNVQRYGVYSAAYGTVHYKEPLKSFEIRVVHIVPASGFLLSRYCNDRAKSDIKQFSHLRDPKINLVWPHPCCWLRGSVQPRLTRRPVYLVRPLDTAMDCVSTRVSVPCLAVCLTRTGSHTLQLSFANKINIIVC